MPDLFVHYYSSQFVKMSRVRCTVASEIQRLGSGLGFWNLQEKYIFWWSLFHLSRHIDYLSRFSALPWTLARWQVKMITMMMSDSL